MIDDRNRLQDGEMEHSDFSGTFTDDQVTVVVNIYRIAGSQDGWRLEVIDGNDGATIWEDLFSTDREAYDEFLATIEREGLATFVDDTAPGTTVH